MSVPEDAGSIPATSTLQISTAGLPRAVRPCGVRLSLQPTLDSVDIVGQLASGDVRAVLQPIVDLDSGAVVAYEALARGPVGELERPDLPFAAVAVGAFHEARHFTPQTASRYEALAGQAGFVAALGAGMDLEPERRVRGASLAADDPVRGEWDLLRRYADRPARPAPVVDALTPR